MDDIDLNLRRVRAALERKCLIPHTIDFRVREGIVVKPAQPIRAETSDSEATSLWRWFGRLLGREQGG